MCPFIAFYFGYFSPSFYRGRFLFIFARSYFCGRANALFLRSRPSRAFSGGGFMWRATFPSSERLRESNFNCSDFPFLVEGGKSP